jgi:shikimate kinase
VALGGGAVVDPANRALVRKIGKIVWLTATPETLWRRAESDQQTSGRRPKLTTAGGLAEIIDILERRTPIYRECADFEVDTEGKTPDSLAGEILERLALVPPAAF